MKRLAIIASHGTLDGAYPPFILASTAIALGWEAGIFFTFYGLQLLRKDLDLRVTSLGNPAMPMPLPVFAQTLPGMEAMMTAMMKKQINDKGVASIEELRAICVESGVRLIACQMTADLFGYADDDFIAGVERGGAATFLEFAGEADVSLFM